jgi:hypothetical protein
VSANDRNSVESSEDHENWCKLVILAKRAATKRIDASHLLTGPIDHILRQPDLGVMTFARLSPKILRSS